MKLSKFLTNRKMDNKSCCNTESTIKNNLKTGILYGLIPHSFCIAFVVFSIVGVTAATSLLKKWLLTPYFFPLLIILSLFFATLSSFFYLKREKLLSLEGIKKKKNYLFILFSGIVGVNLLFYLVIFPLAANLRFSSPKSKALGQNSLSSATISVEIPCSGHAPLIGEELQKIDGVESIRFSLPNQFKVIYDPDKVSLEEILNQEIFNTFKALPV